MQETNTIRIRKHFWDQLVGLLEDKGINKREEQGQFLDVSKGTLLNWKNALCSPELPTLVRIAHLLGCSVDYLIDESVTVKTASADVQAAIKTTGLSEQAVEDLQVCRVSGAEDLLNTISSMIVSDIIPVQMEEGRISGDNPAIRAGFPAVITSDGTGVQGVGLVGALRRNLEASISYEKEQAVLQGMSKQSNTPEGLERWFEQKRKVYAEQTKLENSGYHMMLTCTTATAEGQQYHETLKAEYMKGGRKDGEYHGKD